MIFYHFTSRQHLHGIAQTGLSRGDVPVTPNGPGLIAVWLTTDAKPKGHGLPDGESPVQLTPEMRIQFGIPADATVLSVNKQAVRFKLKIPSTDRRLTHWPRWARKRLAPEWYDELRRAGGERSETWWLYWGTIAPTELLEATDMEAAQPLANWPQGYVVKSA